MSDKVQLFAPKLPAPIDAVLCRDENGKVCIWTGSGNPGDVQCAYGAWESVSGDVCKWYAWGRSDCLDWPAADFCTQFGCTEADLPRPGKCRPVRIVLWNWGEEG